MRKLLIVLACCHALGGCISKDDLNGMATVTSLLVVVPLAPIAIAYDVINDTDGKTQEQLEQWRRLFDPIYQERIEIISPRNPTQDAVDTYRNGKIAFFPIDPGSDFYVGMSIHEHQSDGIKNQAVIDNDNDKLLSSLQLLLENDPAHEDVAGYRYHSPTYDCFYEKAFNYQVMFNHKMSALSNRYKPVDTIKLKEGNCVTQSP